MSWLVGQLPPNIFNEITFIGTVGQGLESMGNTVFKQIIVFNKHYFLESSNALESVIIVIVGELSRNDEQGILQ